jgi:3-phenylpropionate/trans-cinnamate dioxygenase ferredoxin reductase subunit
MKQYKYLIVGGGMAADAAVQGIRSVDPIGKIGLISAERNPPYNRPPLSKGLWKGESVDTIWRKTNDQNATVHLGCTANLLDPAQKRVADTDGNELLVGKAAAGHGWFAAAIAIWR